MGKQVVPPRRLGPYEVGAKIGGGGMATVFLGRAIRDGREELVALKVIRDELAHDENFANMFIDEAKILARLSHPNVIHTLEYGVTPPHRFIAMELLSGRTFADVWDALVHLDERIDLKLAAWICARVADGLHSAHELVDDEGNPLNVIHRDVNPTNIFLTHAGDVKLIDFGLAKMRVRVSKSADGIVKGKIPYLAPEQAQGRPIDRRIDLYALGTSLWEAGTMKRLFKRDTDVDTLKAIRDAHVPDPREMVEGFPDALWAIIEKAVERDPDDRYATAAAMKHDLEAFVAGATGMQEQLAALVSRLFPGGEARAAKWLRDATAVRVPSKTMPPPTPVAMASSSFSEKSTPSDPSPAEVVAKEEPKDDAKKEASVVKKKTTKKKKKSKTRASEAPRDEARRTSRRAPARASLPSVPDDPAEDDGDDPKRLWVSVAIVVVVLVALAIIFGR